MIHVDPTAKSHHGSRGVATGGVGGVATADTSGVATDFRLGVSGRTVSQGNPYQKLKSPRISVTIF